MPVGRALMMRPHPPLPGVSSADLRGVLHPGGRAGMRSSCAASRCRSNGIRCSSRTESREPLRYNEEGLGRVTVAPEPLVGLALLRSRRPVEAADATGDDAPGHQAFALCRRTILLGRAPGNQGERVGVGIGSLSSAECAKDRPRACLLYAYAGLKNAVTNALSLARSLPCSCNSIAPSKSNSATGCQPGAEETA